MQRGCLSRNVAFSAILLGLILFALRDARAGTEQVLVAFDGEKGGTDSYSSLVFDSAGNLYGTTEKGGDLTLCDGVGCGVVFKLTKGSKGSWKETVLYTFLDGQDGAFPSAGLTFDKAGNLYGTTALGGNMSAPLCRESGCGVVFKLSHTPGGWKQKVIHRFNGKDGSQPFSPVTFDQSGNLYGTTVSGGNLKGDGVVFKLTPDAEGHWKEAVLHRFSGGKDGALPFAGVVLDKAGNVYGTASAGGNLSQCSGFGCGVVFQLTPESNGKWRDTLIYSFAGGQDGANPQSLTFDAAGNLYSTTNFGGTQGNGTAFQLSQSNGAWQKIVLHNFGASGDGGGPAAGVILDDNGNLYGTTIYGGTQCGSGCGIVFELSPNSGNWTENILYSFTGGSDGGAPSADLTIDGSGAVYGTTVAGGAHNAGAVFEVSP